MQHQGEAAGISGKAFPYSQVMKGDSPYSIEGLPGELPLRHPKNYGSKQLKEIIKFKEDFNVVYIIFNIYFNLFILKLFKKHSIITYFKAIIPNSYRHLEIIIIV